MTREEVVLGALSAAGRDAFSPVQVQKLFFLIDQNVAQMVDGPHFNFRPYDYGPFDEEVYRSLESLAKQGLIEINADVGRFRRYRLTAEGESAGRTVLESLDERARDYIQRVVQFVKTVSFPDLVAAIYKAYPDMKVNSVFKG